MSSPFFRGFVLLGFLCLWVTPTEQQLMIEQNPNPPIVGADVILILGGIVPSPIRAVFWYQSKQVDPSKLISGRVIATGSTQKGTIPIALDGATVTANTTLKIPNFKKSYVNYYTVQVITDTTMETATTVLIASNSSAISSSILLLAAVLFSSLRLL